MTLYEYNSLNEAEREANWEHGSGSCGEKRLFNYFLSSAVLSSAAFLSFFKSLRSFLIS